MKVTEIYNSCKNYIFSLLIPHKQDIKHAISIFIAIIILLIVVYILKEYPHSEVAHFNITNPKDLAEIENSYRVTLVQMLGGITIGIGLYYTWRRVTIAEYELKISQQGQINERFTRAIDQLGALDQNGKPAIEIRLGGIYALESISLESEHYYWPIIKILTAYVRKNSFVSKKDDQIDHRKGYPECDQDETIVVESLPMDIQTILNVLGSCRRSYSSEKSKHLDLSYTNLSNAKLEGAHLEGFNLEGAYLVKANLKGAYLQEANLYQANLCQVDLCQAHLEETNLKWAHIRGELIKANLERANLEGDRLMVDLKGANLRGANLQRASFKHSFFDEGASLKDANLKGANLEWCYFEGVNLEGANLEGVHIIQPDDLSLDQLSKVKALYRAELDPDIRTWFEEEFPDKYQELIKNPYE